MLLPFLQRDETNNENQYHIDDADKNHSGDYTDHPFGYGSRFHSLVYG